MRLVLAGVFAALATAVPAQAAEIADISVPVSIERQDMVVCVTHPCYQPMPVVVCVWPDDVERKTCTPR